MGARRGLARAVLPRREWARPLRDVRQRRPQVRARVRARARTRVRVRVGVRVTVTVRVRVRVRLGLANPNSHPNLHSPTADGGEGMTCSDAAVYASAMVSVQTWP